jgi:hypothetical protein
MGKKYIITENQERVLSRLVERELGPEESVLVANKNPFKSEAFKNVRDGYYSSLKDGDLFYEIKEDLKPFCEKLYEENLEIVKKIIPNLEGKTIRISADVIYKIIKVNAILGTEGNILFKVLVKIDDSEFAEYTGELASRLDRPYSFSGSFDEITFSEVKFDKRNMVIITEFDESYFTLPLEKANGGPIKFFRTDFCSSNLLQNGVTFGIEEVPDEYFEIRKVQRQKTDF